MNLYSKFLEEICDMYKYVQELDDLINSDYPEITDEERPLLVYWWLNNCHETISTISSELCGYSKSTYDANTYINLIREKQKVVNNSCIKTELFEIINNGCISESVKLEEIKEYLNNLEV